MQQQNKTTIQLPDILYIFHWTKSFIDDCLYVWKSCWWHFDQYVSGWLKETEEISWNYCHVKFAGDSFGPEMVWCSVKYQNDSRKIALKHAERN